MVNKNRQQRKTLLAMGEGDCEYAFLQHLRNIYCSRQAGVNVTIRNAQGGAPENIVNQVVRLIRLANYDRQIVLLDTDLTWSDSLKKTARKNQVEMVGSNPCLEGLLLRILGKSVPEQVTDCKKRLRLLTKKNMNEWHHYEPHFSKELFENARKILTELDKLLVNFEGGSS